MGKITMTGTAKRSVPYDRMKLTLDISTAEATSSKAAAKVEAQCEELLGSLQEKGFSLSQIKVEGVSTGAVRPELQNGGNTAIFTASRRITLDLDFHMGTINFFTGLISEKGWDMAMDTSFSVSDKMKIRKELLKEALEDSRAKAEMIAGSIGQRITGIDEVQAGGSFYGENDSIMSCGGGMLRGKALLSDQLSAAEETISESITVVWIIE
ncbi:MAG TPA: hypothetical protein DCZ62_00415 [Ruminococcus sp.]|nr:hypothetical protein [Ruminococcus sp.]